MNQFKSNALVTGIACPSADLESYISAVYKIPLLSLNEEKDLADDLLKNQDLEAARKLVLSHLRVVVSLSKQYLSYGLPQSDIIQEGNLGLMKAVRRFDPSKGARLFSFAIHWIKAEIHEYILKNWKIVKVATTKSQRKLFFNLRSLKRKLHVESSLKNKDAVAIAEELGVKTKDVIEMNNRLSYSDTPLEGSDGSVGVIDFLEASNSDPAYLIGEEQNSTLRNKLLLESIKKLDERSILILKSRWLNVSDGNKPKTLKQLAEELNISAERVRQIEDSALKELKKILISDEVNFPTT
jgi:RNA polymerase sigma-32 factor